MLIKTAGTNLEADRSVRIINVSSTAHKMIKKINLDNLTFDLDPSGNKFLRIYGISKLCNILFSKELAKKLEPLGELCYFLLFHARWKSNTNLFIGGMENVFKDLNNIIIVRILR